MRTKIIILLLIGWSNLPAQSHHTICGFVEDVMTGERLISATLYETATGKGIACNSYGFYSMTLPQGNHTFRVSYVGYAPTWITLALQTDTVIHVGLKPAGLLDEVVVKGCQYFVRSTQMGIHKLPLEQCKAMPSILGETDVLKALHYLPGVNPGIEGSAGFSVRGSSPEQTQIQLDGMPVYNVNHLFGYFSAFNGEALKDLTLYKGAVPARFGGRLSSVLDIAMREGNMKRFAGNFAMSPLAASLTLEGPIKKDKVSFLISGRYTWLNALLQAGFKIFDVDTRMGLGFYDFNAKVNWLVGKRDHLYVSMYNGHDGIYSQSGHDGKLDRLRLGWGNLGASVRWNRIVNPHTFVNTQLYFSRFRNIQETKIYNWDSYRYDLYKTYSDLKEMAVRTDWDYVPLNAHYFRFGAMVSKKIYAPEMSYRRIDSSAVLLSDVTRGDLWSAALYAEDDWSLAASWKMNIGLRATVTYVPGRSYYSVEPRLALTYLLNTTNSLKASCSFMQQPLHLLANTYQGMPAELWVPATDQVKPGRSNLYSLGYFRQLPKGMEFSVEAYYNALQGMIRYKEGASYLKYKDASWQDYIYRGKGRGYGVEVMLNKSLGALNGWIAYTWSRAERSFAGIRDGMWFPYDYDRPHKLNVTMNYTFEAKEEQKYIKMVALNFTYASGNYTTVGQQMYPAASMPGNIPIPENRENQNFWQYMPYPNNTQLPAYHHLDIALHLKNNKRKGESWTIGIYNVYGRKNPSYYFSTTSKSGKTQIERMSICMFVPCITWSYTF